MSYINTFITKYRYSAILLQRLVITDFKVRYQSSLLGHLWSLLKPALLFIIMYLVFVKVLKVDYGVENSGAYLLLGLVMWTFFTEITVGSVGSIVGRGDLLRKLSFPRYVLVFSPAVSAFINMLINLSVVLVFMFVVGITVNWTILIAPLLIGEIFIFAIGIGFFLSATYVKLRDIGYVWDVIIQVLFYATPIFFPVTLAPIWAQKIIMINPLAQSIQDLRYVMISPDTVTIQNVFGDDPLARLIPIVITLFVFITGALYFKKHSKNFAEEL